MLGKLFNSFPRESPPLEISPLEVAPELYSRPSWRRTQSNHSSANLSMRNGDNNYFDNSYQRPDFSRSRAGSVSSMYEVSQTGPSLLPMPNAREGDSSLGMKRESWMSGPRYRVPPLHDPRNLNQNYEPSVLSLPMSSPELSSPRTNSPKEARDCYMCGELIPISRKREWQMHVLQDLKPYQCMESDCVAGDQVYDRLTKLCDHYSVCHADAGFLTSTPWRCVFCEIELLEATSDRLSHVGRHMEEIAFSIVPRQHEEWEFYDDSDTNIGPGGLSYGMMARNDTEKRKRDQEEPFAERFGSVLTWTCLYSANDSLCRQRRFSWNSLFQHEQEVHGLPPYNDSPWLCDVQGCVRAQLGNGFQNLDQQKYHKFAFHPPQDSSKGLEHSSYDASTYNDNPIGAYTPRRCANCGLIGHIKTNKKLCPLLSGQGMPQVGPSGDECLPSPQRDMELPVAPLAGPAEREPT